MLAISSFDVCWVPDILLTCSVILYTSVMYHVVDFPGARKVDMVVCQSLASYYAIESLMRGYYAVTLMLFWTMYVFLAEDVGFTKAWDPVGDWKHSIVHCLSNMAIVFYILYRKVDRDVGKRIS